MFAVTVVPGHAKDGVGEDGFRVVSVEFLEFGHEEVEHGAVLFALVQGLDGFGAHLQEAAGVGGRAVLFYHGGGGQKEDFSFDSLGIGAGTLPETGCLRLEEVDAQHPVQLAQALHSLFKVGARYGGVHAPDHEAFEFGVHHVIEHVHEGMGFGVLGQPVVAEIVVLGSLVAVEGFQHADHKLRGV